jgi:hypothetical protein
MIQNSDAKWTYQSSVLCPHHFFDKSTPARQLSELTDSLMQVGSYALHTIN